MFSKIFGKKKPVAQFAANGDPIKHNTYLFKLDHWINFQEATVLYVSDKYIVMEKRFDGNSKAGEFCINRHDTDYTFLEIE